MHCCCEVSQLGLEAYPHTGCIPPGFGKTRTHTHRNPYPWAQVWVFWGTGAGSPGKPQGYLCQSLIMGGTDPNLEDQNLGEGRMEIDLTSPENIPTFRHNALVVATYPWASG